MLERRIGQAVSRAKLVVPAIVVEITSRETRAEGISVRGRAGHRAEVQVEELVARRRHADGRAVEHVDGAAVEAAQRISRSLFSDDLGALTESDFEQLAQDGMPGIALDRAQAGLIDAIVAAGLAKSKSEARTFVQGAAVSVNGNKVDSLEHTIADAERLFGRFTVLRRGKKNYSLISWQ